MLAADTNVLVRLLVSDDLAQQRAVAARLRRESSQGRNVLVSTVVLAELAWVLDSVYGYPRPRIAGAIDAILTTPPFRVKERPAVQRALEWFRAGPAEFSDYLILALSMDDGAEGLLTFDRDLLQHPAALKP
jgi:predicted nucleic-acid-binding protein